MQKYLYIIQYRTDVSKMHEQACFLEEYADFSDTLRFIDAITEPLPLELNDVAGVILGGSGEFMLGEGDGTGTWKEKTFSFIDRVIEADIPLLGICFGYQLLALHQGASITNESSMRETGTRCVLLLDEAATDPLFAGLPAVFDGQFGHKETIISPPEHLQILARTDRVACNSFRVYGKRAWGTLMHPELTPKRFISRLALYPLYAGGLDTGTITSSLRESPEAPLLLKQFFSLGVD